VTIGPFNNTYAGLSDRFYARLLPTPVQSPKLLKFNHTLAADLGLTTSQLSAEDLAMIFSGNSIPVGADPLAMAYAGHQFGGWSPQLGDGRAILLGEISGFDIQLKGSGRTPWSRGGDGRAWLGPVLREYLLSESMNALGIPTTRALAAVSTGESVMRETLLPGAIVTRVASSHLRVGTFQYFAARQDLEALQELLNYAINRLYPTAQDAENPALTFLQMVSQNQAKLVAKWMGVGFIHGVMNTDNCAISGETIDFGPCAFMDDYQSNRVFSSIDHQGRYAYSNQPRLAHWNLAQLASSLLPLIDPDADKAVEMATKVIDGFVGDYQNDWQAVFAAKIGVDDPALISSLLQAMELDKADFTITFRALNDLKDKGSFSKEQTSLNQWLPEWRKRLDTSQDLNLVNPALIPRNHQVEEMIDQAQTGNYEHFEMLLSALSTPFQDPPEAKLMDAPKPEEVVQATFCGT